ncbi:unnamed protein product [Cuscuta campestris]|uniref:Uncharacterized protein n=1 Tax=Cuscuta campestris TaxID=132261 RepID=A0A484N676_9ASTE|nr:unnamed protein product [Cuscuta campestris]
MICRVGDIRSGSRTYVLTPKYELVKEVYLRVLLDILNNHHHYTSGYIFRVLLDILNNIIHQFIFLVQESFNNP